MTESELVEDLIEACNPLLDREIKRLREKLKVAEELSEKRRSATEVWVHKWNSMRDHRDRLREKNTELQGIVDELDNLDKFKDGASAYLGDEAWLLIEGEVRQGWVRSDVDVNVRIHFIDESGKPWNELKDYERPIKECYSTQAAAQAAKGKEA